MKRKYGVKKVLGLLMCASLLISGAVLPAKAEDSDDMPDTIKMPVSIYDHLNDGLLFEYPLDGGKAADQLGEDLDMYSNQDIWGSKSLIEETLDAKKKTPVYTQETVEKVAGIVKELIDSGYKGGKTDADGNAANEVYKKLYQQITGYEFGKTGEPIILLPEQQAFGAKRSYSEMGWTLTDSQGNSANENGESWQKVGDWLYAKEAGAKATFDFQTLEAGSYTLQYYALNKMTATLHYGEQNIDLENATGKYWGDSGDKVAFTLTEAGRVWIEFTANEQDAAFCNGILAKTDGTVVRKDITEYEDKVSQLSDYNIQEEGTTKWQVGQYGITSSNAFDSDAGVIYIDQVVTPDTAYKLSCTNERCRIAIAGDNEETLAEFGSSEQSAAFAVPKGVNCIRITITQDADVLEVGYRGVRDMKLIQVPQAKLGTYDEAQEKFSDGTAKSSVIASCMDYAYYMLNNFWSSTGDDITKKTTNYTTLTLSRNENGYYTIDQDNLVYDLENKTIYKDPDAPRGSGYFPLDSSVLGENSDLDGRFGVADGEIEIPLAEDGSTVSHNYHFATKAHTQFVYQKGMQFEFVGDDDVYLFIDNQKVLDIGGAHTSESGTVKLDELGLEEGEVYDMDFYHLERHSVASNFSISTNITFNIPKASCSVEFTDSEGNLLKDGEPVQTGSEIGITYRVTAGSKGTNDEPWMTNVSFIDDPLGVKISKDGISLTNGIFVNGELVFEVRDKDGNLVVDESTHQEKVVKISQADFEDESKVQEFLQKVSALTVDKDQTVSVSGLCKKVDMDVVASELEAKLDVTMNKYNEETYQIEKSVETATTTASLKIIPKNEPKAGLAVTFTDKEGTVLSPSVPENTPVYIQYTLTAESGRMKGIDINDAGAGIHISKTGISIPEGYEADDKVIITQTKADGTESSLELAKDELANVIMQFDGDSENAWVLDTGDTIKITGIYTTITEEHPSVEVDVSASLSGPVFGFNEEQNNVTITYQSPKLAAKGKVELAVRTNPQEPEDSDDPANNPDNHGNSGNSGNTPGTPANNQGNSGNTPGNPINNQGNPGKPVTGSGQNTGSGTVKTGDPANSTLYVALLLLSIGGIIISIKYASKNGSSRR